MLLVEFDKYYKKLIIYLHMPIVTLLRPEIADRQIISLHGEAMDYALESVRNLAMIEGGIRVRLRQALLHGRTLPTLPTLCGIIDSEVRAASTHVHFGGSAETFRGMCAVLAGPDKHAERLESIVRYTVMRVIETGMNDDAERGVLFQRRDELLARTTQLMAARKDPLAALQVAVAELLSTMRAVPAERGGESHASLSKIARQMQRGRTSRSRVGKRPHGDEVS